MNNRETDRTIGVIFIVAVAFSFAGTSNVQAAPTFPPAHQASGVGFDETAEPSRIVFPGPWYRPRPDNSIASNSDRQTAQEPRYVFVEREHGRGPWYRATN